MNARLLSVSSEQAFSAKRDALLHSLRGFLRASFELRRTGGSQARLYQSQGYADGFLQALIQSGVATEAELLELVREVRRGVDGPETRALLTDDSIFAA